MRRTAPFAALLLLAACAADTAPPEAATPPASPPAGAEFRQIVSPAGFADAVMGRRLIPQEGGERRMTFRADGSIDGTPAEWRWQGDALCIDQRCEPVAISGDWVRLGGRLWRRG